LVLLLKTGFTREHREAMKVKVSAFEEMNADIAAMRRDADVPGVDNEFRSR